MVEQALSLARIQAKLMDLLSEGADVETIQAALKDHPELKDWLESLDARGVETAGVLVKKWGRPADPDRSR